MCTQQLWIPSHIHDKSKMFPMLSWRDLFFRPPMLPMEHHETKPGSCWSWEAGEAGEVPVAGAWHLGEPASRVTRPSLQETPAGSRLWPVPWMEGCWGPGVGRAAVCQVPACPELGCPGRWQQGCATACSAWGPVWCPDLGIIFSRIKSLNVSV